MKGFADGGGSEPLSVRIPGFQQSNTSVVFGEKYILKVYRKPEAGINPDLEVNRFLTESPGPVLAPKVLGWLEYKLADGTWATLGLLQEFVTDSRDAWNHARDEIYKFFDRALAEYGSQDIRLTQAESSANPLDCEVPEAVRGLAGGFLSTAELLGRRTAEMHLALGRDTKDPRFASETYGTLYQRSIYQSMRNTALKSLRLLRQRLPQLSAEVRVQAQELLASEKQVMAILEEFRKAPITSSRMRHHGDFHLGQVLFTGKDFQILDFEGEPARPLADRVRKRSPLRDVAGMIRSFHYASLSALYHQSDSGVVRPADRERLEVWGRRWHRWVSAAYLRAYLKAAEGAHFLPADRKETRILLRVFLLEKALYEVAYELNNRPEWTGIPLRSISELIQDKAPS